MTTSWVITIVIIVFIVFIYFLYILYLYTNVLRWFMRIKIVVVVEWEEQVAGKYRDIKGWKEKHNQEEPE